MNSEKGHVQRRAKMNVLTSEKRVEFGVLRRSVKAVRHLAGVRHLAPNSSVGFFLRNQPYQTGQLGQDERC